MLLVEPRGTLWLPFGVEWKERSEERRRIFRGPYLLAAMLAGFLLLFSIQMGWLSPSKKGDDAVAGSGSMARPPRLTETNSDVPKEGREQLEQQLRAAQSKVTSMSVELDAMLLQRKDALTEATSLSNILVRVTRESDAFKKQAATALEEAKAEILARSRRIEVLEGEIGALTQQLRDLAERLGRQDARIAETERRMANSESERVALKATLDALQAERRILEARFNAKEAMLADVTRQRNSEVAARDSLFRRNWLAKSKAAEAAKQTKSSASKPAVSKPGSGKVRVDVSEVAPPRPKAPAKPSRTNAPASSTLVGKSR